MAVGVQLPRPTRTITPHMPRPTVLLPHVYVVSVWPPTASGRRSRVVADEVGQLTGAAVAPREQPDRAGRPSVDPTGPAGSRGLTTDDRRVRTWRREVPARDLRPRPVRRGRRPRLQEPPGGRTWL